MDLRSYSDSSRNTKDVPDDQPRAWTQKRDLPSKCLGQVDHHDSRDDVLLQRLVSFLFKALLCFFCMLWRRLLTYIIRVTSLQDHWSCLSLTSSDERRRERCGSVTRDDLGYQNECDLSLLWLISCTHHQLHYAIWLLTRPMISNYGTILSPPTPDLTSNYLSADIQYMIYEDHIILSFSIPDSLIICHLHLHWLFNNLSNLFSSLSLRPYLQSLSEIDSSSSGLGASRTGSVRWRVGELTHISRTLGYAVCCRIEGRKDDHNRKKSERGSNSNKKNDIQQK